jgi:hypothetical protein
MFLSVIPELHPEVSEYHSTVTEVSSQNDSGVTPELQQVSSQRETEVPTLKYQPKEASVKDSALRAEQASEEVSEDDFASLVVVVEDNREQTLRQAPELSEKHERLLEAIQPITDYNVTYERWKTLDGVLILCDATEIDPLDLLRFNRAHKQGPLRIRTPEQFSAAVMGTDEEYHMLNEYKTHHFRECPACKKAGVHGYPEPRAAKGVAAGKGFDVEEA